MENWDDIKVAIFAHFGSAREEQQGHKKANFFFVLEGGSQTWNKCILLNYILDISQAY